MSHYTSSTRDNEASATEAGQLDETVREIGVARFVGRINSGVIDATHGYQAVERFANAQAERSLLSRVTHVLLGRTDTFGPR